MGKSGVGTPKIEFTVYKWASFRDSVFWKSSDNFITLQCDVFPITELLYSWVYSPSEMALFDKYTTSIVSLNLVDRYTFY